MRISMVGQHDGRALLLQLSLLLHCFLNRMGLAWESGFLRYRTALHLRAALVNVLLGLMCEVAASDRIGLQ